jgi:carbamoyl-phosphate synthase small subunit
MNKASLVLEDGTAFVGESIGSKGLVVGPLFFDTAVVGYQEIITDPANAGKILMLTYPLIGNYGVSEKFNQSEKAWIKGLVVKEKSKIYSNWQAKDSLDNFLKQENLVAIAEVDTRTLAVHLREKGEIWAAISTNGKRKEDLIELIKKTKKSSRCGLIKEISTREIKLIKGKSKIKLGILDLGITQSIIRQLQNLGLEIIILPYNSTVDKMLQLKLNGLIISSGPEDDSALGEITVVVKDLIGKIPILGISLGAQLLARALGAKVKKMHLGHHGVNYPIKPAHACKGEITVQNHSWVIELDSLKKIKEVKIIAVNLNDGTVEEFDSKKYKIMAAQYLPESPGFREVNAVLIKFLKLMKGR